ncbi:O-antigen translocase [Phytopseudomonas seleniipraecipitans]|uniref:Polysaccharide transporter, PST family n=1 Tax=Phytopseudomonas seleniipraecipitans TaxID=640205 RepID=A0A1G7V0N4_9GAMM|nr:O-antigen translocase [Pseudomonas seleniipraecipitans]SDG53284.1 polysaccharide transporter, PST family [Pseudomonas seleniipraecipitans]
MTLIKTSLLSGIAVLIKILTLLGINKILAIYVGPTGYAAIGQFQNALQMITTFASGAINTGVTKYTAEYQSDVEKQIKVWRTAGTIAISGSIVTGLLVAVFSKELASWFLNDESLSGVFIWFALTLVFFILNTLLLAILNGKKEIYLYVLANIVGSIFSLFLTCVMAVKYGLYGALVALSIYQSLAFFVTLYICYRTTWFRFDHLFGALDRESVLNLAKYTAMALTSAACVPVSHILVRNHLGETLGWNVAGYWEATWRLSGAYLMLITTTLSVYYLPRLSELRFLKDIKHEILLGYKIILPMTAFIGVTVYLLRDLIIEILFTKDFSPMRELFAWQLLGDTLKIGSWILAYLMLGKAMVKTFIFTEIVFCFVFYLAVVVLTGKFGFVGVAMAHVFTYALYWPVVAIAVLKVGNRDSIFI